MTVHQSTTRCARIKGQFQVSIRASASLRSGARGPACSQLTGNLTGRPRVGKADKRGYPAFPPRGRAGSSVSPTLSPSPSLTYWYMLNGRTILASLHHLRTAAKAPCSRSLSLTPTRPLSRATRPTPPLSSAEPTMASRLAQLASHITGHPGTGGPVPAPLTGNLLQDQVCLITGSGQGIGRSCALLFAAHGAKVVISDLDGAKADSVRKEIEDVGGKDAAITVAGNVMEDGFAERLVKAAVDKWGKINVIVNNAGFTK